MNIMEKLLTREITRQVEVDEDGEKVTKNETEELKNILNDEKDIWLANDNYIISHKGIQKLAQWVGAYWEKYPKVVSEPKPENKFRDAFLCTCYFPDGTFHTEVGEASNENTSRGISQSYKMTMALKRGNDKAFLRSAYVGLFDVYSEDESEDFKPPKPQYPFSGESLRYIALREDDVKYPNVHLLDIWTEHKDKEYIEVLTLHEDPMIRMVAKGMLHRIEKIEQEEIQIETEKTEETQMDPTNSLH